jgi:hypothetical protein
MASSDEMRKTPTGVKKTIDLSGFKSSYPETASMVPQSRKREWMDHKAAMEEATIRMRLLGIKKDESLPTRRNNTTSILYPVGSADLMRTSRTAGEAGVGVSSGVVGVAPAFSGWTVWADPDEILEAAERIKEKRLLSPTNPDMESVNLRCFGAPTPPLQELCQSASLVRADITWFQRPEHFFQAMRKRVEDKRSGEATAVAVALVAGAEGLQAPEVVTLPPRIPKLRLEDQTAAVGIVEQYEKFIVVEDQVFSPICEWGKEKRSKGITADSLSNRCIQYFVVRGLNSAVPPEEIKTGMAKMLAEGKEWRKEWMRENPNSLGVGKSFWPQKASDTYNSFKNNNNSI